MKYVWILKEMTFLNGGEGYYFENYIFNTKAFSNFNAAKKAFRERIKELSQNDNPIFKDGYIKHFKKFLDEDYEMMLDALSDKEEALQSENERKLLNDEFQDIIKNLFTNPEYSFKTENLKKFNTENYQYAIISDENGLLIRGNDDGPSNGCNPYVLINCFEMDNSDKDYHIHIDDCFDIDYQESESTLFLDLEKVEAE